MKTLNTVVLFAGLLLLGGCSVYMAAKKDGVDVNEASQCKTRGCLQAKGAELVDSQPGATGELVETYKLKKPTGSTGRAVMHGLLDVATLGIWEVAGTPIEGAQGKAEYVSVKVISNKESGEIKKVELLQ